MTPRSLADATRSTSSSGRGM